MAITKEVIRQCLISKREEIESAEVVFRPFEFDENGNYVFVGVRHVGKSYMMYQRVLPVLKEALENSPEQKRGFWSWLWCW